MGALCARAAECARRDDDTGPELVHLTARGVDIARRLIQPNTRVVKQTELYQALISSSVLEQLRDAHERHREVCFSVVFACGARLRVARPGVLGCTVSRRNTTGSAAGSADTARHCDV